MYNFYLEEPTARFNFIQLLEFGYDLTVYIIIYRQICGLLTLEVSDMIIKYVKSHYL